MVIHMTTNDAGSSQNTGSRIPEATESNYGCSRELRQTSIMRYAEQLPPKPADNDDDVNLEPDPGEGRESFVTTLRRDEEENQTFRNKEELSEKPPETEVMDESYGVDKEREAQSAAPSSTEPSCNINKKGFCSTHQVQTLKTSVTSKKWGDRGGGRGYGYITRKTSKYVCKPSLRDQNHETSTNCR